MSGAVATRPTASKGTLADMIAAPRFKEQLALSLPTHMDPDRFARIALTAMNRTPKLLECTQGSVFKCLYDLSALGLEPDGRHAHLIPYGTECTLVIDYKGLVALVRRSGEIANIHADVVYEGDDLKASHGTGAKLEHVPAALTGRPKGKVRLVYSFVRFKDGTEEFDLMDVEAVEAVRARSRSKNNGPWVTDWNEMAKKTVFRRHAKWLPLSSELREKMEQDDEPLTERERFAAAKPVFAAEAEPAPALDPFAAAAAHKEEKPKPAAKTEPPPAAPAEEENPAPGAEQEPVGPVLQAHGILRGNLTRGGFTCAQLLRYAIGMRYIEPCPITTPIEQALGGKIASQLIDEWEENVVPELEALRIKGEAR